MKQANRLALLGLLTALAFALSYLEHILPLQLPIPGFKLGLANIITVFALYELNLRDTSLILLVRCFLSALLFGGPTSFLFSITGGALAVVCMFLLRNNRHLSVYGVSMAGACAHNAGQVLAAMLVMRTPGIASYLLFLWPISIPTGALTALVFSLCSRAFRRAFRRTQI